MTKRSDTLGEEVLAETVSALEPEISIRNNQFQPKSELSEGQMLHPIEAISSGPDSCKNEGATASNAAVQNSAPTAVTKNSKKIPESKSKWLQARFMKLKELDVEALQKDHSPPYIEGPLAMEVEPPPTNICQGERPMLKRFMILICDESFCFKSLRRFRLHVSNFVNSPITLTAFVS